MRTGDFDFELPAELIAQQPAPQRDASRLLVLHRATGRIEHRQFRDLPQYLRPGDVLALNDTRVIPARLRGRNAHTAGQFEVLLLAENAVNDWWVMLRPGKRARVGTSILFQDAAGRPSPAQAVVTETNAEGHRRLRFTGVADVADLLDSLGEVPLPPYIRRDPGGDSNLSSTDRERYQTVYAGPKGSVAAPTAGLHFTAALLDELRAQGVLIRYLTLHVGAGTFAPVKTEDLAAHTMHEERFWLCEETARVINDAKQGSAPAKRVVAVGTTTVRVLESVAACHDGRLVAGAGKTRIFIHPPYDFKITDVLLTNFHLPRSTLLMLVSAFAAPGEIRGRDLLQAAYSEAIREHYRFFSYGDAMLLL
jgi:S-adenosylmethionine:tRNA ribosyltransferase-isomerase